MGSVPQAVTTNMGSINSPSQELNVEFQLLDGAHWGTPDFIPVNLKKRTAADAAREVYFTACLQSIQI